MLGARLRAFLPAMASANAALDAVVAEKGAGAVDIEAVDEGKPHIAMEVAIAELGEDSSSSSDSGADEVGGESCGLGGVGEVARSGRRRRPIIIDVEGDGRAAARDGEELDERDAASVDSADAAASAAATRSATGGDVPSGQWITGAALKMRRKDIMRLIAAADGGGAAAATLPQEDTGGEHDASDGAAATSSSAARKEER